jgi:hypothetical protein
LEETVLFPLNVLIHIDRLQQESNNILQSLCNVLIRIHFEYPKIFTPN